MKNYYRLITIDRAYILWLELKHKTKKHIYDKNAKTFGQYCDELKREEVRII